ncbi:hypothetical protein EYB25_008026 [Talaromyces marneffei]|nr:hypothetical protein EYB25_008026 [Talaromyces marneffei]
MVLSDHFRFEAISAFGEAKWIAGVALVLGFFLFKILGSGTSVNADIPFVGLHLGSVSKRKAKYVSDANALLTEGYKVFKNGLFQITTTEGTRIVAGQKYYQELCDLKDDELSFKGSISDLFATHYTGVLISDDLKETAINRDLTQNMARLTSKIEDEVEWALADQIGSCKDWKPVVMNDVSQKIIAHVTARAFNPDLARDPDWIRISVDYWMDAFAAAKTIKFFPVWLRPLAAKLMAQPARMRATREEAQRLVIPVLKRRLALPENEKPDDMMQWMMNRLGDKAGTPEELHHQAHLQLALAMGAIHSTNFTLLHQFFDLAAYQEYHEPLRQEYREALEKTGGKLTKATLGMLNKLDSFMKESQRYNPPGLTNGRRKTLKDIRLNDGTIIPQNSNIEIAANAVNRDPAIHEDPDVFDGFRFYKMRQRSEEDTNRHQFVSSSPNSLNWGYGRHACPGRFFAVDEIKLILSKVLQKYDISLVNPGEGRYKNTSFETMVIPDMKKEVLFRERK